MVEDRVPPVTGGLFLGIASVEKATGAVALDIKSGPVSRAICTDGGLTTNNRSSTEQIVGNVIHMALHNELLHYADLNTVVISFPEAVDGWYKSALITELKLSDERLEHVNFVIISDLDSAMYHNSKNGPGAVHLSGPPDQTLIRNRVGETRRVIGTDGGQRVADLIFDSIVKGSSLPGFDVLEQKLVERLHLNTRDELEDIDGFFDPITNRAINREVIELIATQSSSRNVMARKISSDIARYYAASLIPLIESLKLQTERFPVTLANGIWEAKGPCRLVYMMELTKVAPNAYLVPQLELIGHAEALMALAIHKCTA
jgi:hypothetical protein